MIEDVIRGRGWGWGIKAGAIPTRSRSLDCTYNRHGQREIHETGPCLQKTAETEGPGERTEGPVQDQR